MSTYIHVDNHSVGLAVIVAVVVVVILGPVSRTFCQLKATHGRVVPGADLISH